MDARGAAPAGSGRVYVWELPVRVAHWTTVISIVVLTLTGLYLHSPFVSPASSDPTPSLMASVRFIHELTAIVFTIAVGLRVYWSFAGNRWANWRSFVPYRREHLRDAREMLRFYLYRRPAPPPSVGHNRLAAAFYLIVYAGFAGQILTGLLLFGWLVGSGPIAFLFGWVALVPGGIQTVRLLHYLLTFAFLGFAVHHVYSSVLIDSVERNGLISSMLTGFKNLPSEHPAPVTPREEPTDA